MPPHRRDGKAFSDAQNKMRKNARRNNWTAVKNDIEAQVHDIAALVWSLNEEVIKADRNPMEAFLNFISVEDHARLRGARDVRQDDSRPYKAVLEVGGHRRLSARQRSPHRRSHRR